MEPTTIFRPANWFALLDWRSVFADASRPLEVDVGCGKGAFLVWAARSFPDRNFLGIERQLVRLRKVDGKVRRAGLTNVRLIRCEAGYCVGKLIPSRTVSAYHIYFPDPWPKRRHQSRRLFQPEFVEQLHRTLCNGGVVHLATDDADYFAQIERLMTQSGLFRQDAPQLWPAEAQTEFEKIFLAAGQPIGRARFWKIAAVTAPPVAEG